MTQGSLGNIYHYSSVLRVLAVNFFFNSNDQHNCSLINIFLQLFAHIASRGQKEVAK
jgi:hypothetical protein